MSRVTIGEALHLAIQHHSANRLKEAEAIYRQILTAEPNHPDALHFLGVIAHQCNHHDAAIELINISLSLMPNNYGAYNNLGEAYRMSGKMEQAIVAYRTALQQNPQMAEALGNIGLVQFTQGKVDESLETYNKALAINPKLPQTLSNLGNALLEKKELDKALSAYDAAIAADPMLADAYNNRGSALEHADRLDEAYDSYRRAMEINPQFAIACNNAANISRRLCRWEEARAWCRRALEIDPKHEPATWNEGLIELTLGFYQVGLPKYELRFTATPQRLPKDLFGMRWDGSDPTGKTILLVAEQGLGDTWQAARYAPLLADRGATVIVEAAPPQVNMLKRVRGVSEVVEKGTQRPTFDFYVPMMSLPLRFETTLTSIENRVPYLHTEPTFIDKWKEKLAAYGDAKKVGLLWRGSPVPEPLRSCKLADMAPFGRVPGVKFFGLQVGDGAEEAATPPKELDFVDLSAEVKDFDELTGCMMNLDLIITIDTAAAHLAGALARPTWVLLPFSPDWRWGLDKTDCLWYPTMRLFRQTVRKQWGDVMERTADALASWAGENNG